jgi:pyridoxal 5'-phosphate synthase pdxT subunit
VSSGQSVAGAEAPGASRIHVGVLALQGAVDPHLRQLSALAQVDVRRVRCAADLADLAGLILPGGESTTLLRLLAEAQLAPALRDACASLCVWGVCAGAILLARQVRPMQPSLGVFDILIERNAYGRQQDSFVTESEGWPVAFIRAPRILEHGPSVQVKGSHEGYPTWLEQGRLWVTTFHPELASAQPSPWHRRFVERCRASAQARGQ